ncbi:hypothetical protein D3C71_1495820 [compost metagenome]
MVAVGRQRQAQAHVLLLAVAQAGKTGKVARVIAAVEFGLVDRIAAVRAQAAVLAAAQGQPQLVGLDRAAQVERRAIVVAEGVVPLRGAVQRDLARPILADLARDDVDHPAHRIGSVQGGHGAPHDLDAFNGRHRRNEVGVDVAKAVGTRAGAVLVQALAVHQHQRVVAGQPADADVHAARFTAPLHGHAFYIRHRVGQVVERLGFQLFASDHRNGRRRVLDLLLEAGRRHHDGIHLDDTHRVFPRAGGGLRVGAARGGNRQHQRQQAE